MTNERLSVGVIGGGLLGMTLSLRLAQAGHEVTLMEGANVTGGVAGSCPLGTYRWDRFYHVILQSDVHLLALLEELGLKNRIQWGVTRTGYYTKGRFYSVSSLIEYLLFPPLSIFNKLRLGWTILYASKIKNWQRLESLTSADWLKRHSGRATFEKLWLPLLKSKLGTDYDKANAAFIWATISRLYAARRTGLKKEMFGYVAGGYQTILDALQQKLNENQVRTLVGTEVIEVTGEGLRARARTATGESFDFSRIILTVPCNRILEICPELSIPEKQRLRSIVHQDIICAALILKKPLSGFYITNIADQEVPFTGIIEMTALVDKSNFGGNSLVYLPRYLTKGDPFFEKSGEEILAQFMNSLKFMYPNLQSGDLVAQCVSKVIDFPVIPTLSYSERSLPPTRISRDNLFIVNSSQIPNGTNNVNEVIKLANSSASEILSAQGDP